MAVMDVLHGKYVFGRRVRVLARHFAELLPEGVKVLDVGCGDGTIDRLVLEQRGDLAIEGIDVMLRPETAIEVKLFDGKRIPHGDKSFDVVMFVDVLHHTEDPMVLLREAARVARRGVLIKDHTRNGLMAGTTLRFMDWVGNARHGVVLPYNYWTKRQWMAGFEEAGLEVKEWRREVGLYGWPAGWVFGRGLHFVGFLGVKG
jgi:ubiquinone/menaquinone biosynthesis C-methylase UbiE